MFKVKCEGVEVLERERKRKECACERATGADGREHVRSKQMRVTCFLVPINPKIWALCTQTSCRSKTKPPRTEMRFSNTITIHRRS